MGIALLLLLAATLPARAQVRFSRDVAPLLVRKCVVCHGERTAQGGWRAHTYRALLGAGKSGKPAVVPGKPDASPLLQRLTAVPALRMPQGDDPLPAEAIATIRRWIREGARFDGPDPATPIAALTGPRTHSAAPAAYRAPTPVLALALAPGGKTLAAGGYHEVTLWDPETGRLTGRLGGLPQRIQSLAWSRDGARLLVGGGTPGEYGELALVERATGKRRVLALFSDIVLAAALSPDESAAVAGGADLTVRAVRVADAAPLWSHKVHADWVTAVGFTADGRFVASAGRDKVVKVAEAATGTLFTTYNGHNRNIGRYRGQAPVWALAFPAGTGRVLSAGGGAWVQIWEPEKAQAETGDAGDMEERFQTRSHARHLPHHLKGAVFALAFDGAHVYAAGEDGQAAAYDPETLTEVRRYGAPGDWIYSLAVDPAAQRLATGAYDGRVRVYDTKTGRPVADFLAAPGLRARGAQSPSPQSQQTPPRE